MRLSMIAAQSDNRVIGRRNRLPWHLPEDLKHFKRLTLGKPIILGRKTFESIGRPLPGRLNIVVSRRRGYQPDGVQMVASLDEALACALSHCESRGLDEALVIGGAQVYAQALPRVERLYLTQVHAVVEGDSFFPELDLREWHEVERQTFEAHPPNPYPYSFLVLERRARVQEQG